MATKVTEIPAKTYKKLLEKNYIETKQNANRIKRNFNQRQDPILQKDDKFIPPPRTKGKHLIVKDKYEDKPDIIDRNSRKRIYVRGNLANNMDVITEDTKPRGIRINSAQRRGDESFKRRKIDQKPKPVSDLSMRFFFQDYSNSAKPSYNDRYFKKGNVSKN